MAENRRNSGASDAIHSSRSSDVAVYRADIAGGHKRFTARSHRSDRPSDARIGLADADNGQPRRDAHNSIAYPIVSLGGECELVDSEPDPIRDNHRPPNSKSGQAVSSSPVGVAKLYRVDDRESVLRLRPEIATWINDAISYSGGRVSLLDAAEPDKVWWLALIDDEPVAVMVTTVVNYNPSARFLMLMLMGGSHYTKWIHLFEELKTYARNNSLTGIESCMRRGMARAMQSVGMTETHRFMEFRV